MSFVQQSLLGIIPEPSDTETSDRSERTTSNALTSSPEDSRANLRRQQVCAVDRVTSGGFGQNSLESCASFDLATRSWRTSQGYLPSATEPPSEKFSEIWPRSGTMRGGIVSPLPTSARLNAASGSGSSLGWPTPIESDSRDGARHTTTTGISHSGTSLTDAIRMWPTPNAMISNDGETIETWQERAEELKEKGYNGNGAGMPLAIAIQQWPTPTAENFRHRSGTRTEELLDRLVKQWPTPQGHDGEHGPRGAASAETRDQGRVRDLPNAVQWPTPMARDHKSGRTKADYGNARPLSEAILWATPTAVEATRGPGHSGRDDSPNLTTQEASIETRKKLGALNPDWVETLMGVPMGWTSIPKDLVSGLKSTLKALGLRLATIHRGGPRRPARSSTTGSRPARRKAPT